MVPDGILPGRCVFHRRVVFHRSYGTKSLKMQTYSHRYKNSIEKKWVYMQKRIHTCISTSNPDGSAMWPTHNIWIKCTTGRAWTWVTWKRTSMRTVCSSYFITNFWATMRCYPELRLRIDGFSTKALIFIRNFLIIKIAPGEKRSSKIRYRKLYYTPWTIP